MAVDAARPVKQHYIQASVQIVLYVYWGYFWLVGDVRPMVASSDIVHMNGTVDWRLTIVPSESRWVKPRELIESMLGDAARYPGKSAFGKL